MFRERLANVYGDFGDGGAEILVAVDDEDVRTECKGLKGELLEWEKIIISGGVASEINL